MTANVFIGCMPNWQRENDDTSHRTLPLSFPVEKLNHVTSLIPICAGGATGKKLRAAALVKAEEWLLQVGHVCKTVLMLTSHACRPLLLDLHATAAFQRGHTQQGEMWQGLAPGRNPRESKCDCLPCSHQKPLSAQHLAAVNAIRIA